MNQNPIDIVDIAAKNIMPEDRDYIFDITDRSALTTGIVKAGAASISLDAGKVVLAGPVIAGDGVVASGGLSVDATHGINAAGQCGVASIAGGTNIATVPEFAIGSDGAARVISLGIGPQDGVLAGVTAAGAATLLSASIGTAGSEEVTIDATGITAPAFNGDLVRATTEYRPCNMQPDDMTGTEWTRGAGVPVYSLGASQTGKILWGYVTEPEGRTLVSWKCGGGFVDADVSGSLTAQMFAYPLGVETAVGAAVTLTRDGARWSCTETLAAPVVLAASTVYAIKITATTGADDSFTCDYCRTGSK